MNKQLTKALKKLQALQLKDARAVLWVIKRSPLRDGIANYNIASVRTEQSLQKKLVDIASKAIKSAIHAEEYEYLTEDKDDDVTLGVKLAETDLNAIVKQIAKGSDNPQVRSAEELFDSWSYAIELHVGDERVLAVHKIPEGWKLKQKEKSLSVLFKDHMLLDFEDNPVFKLDKKIDFFAYEGLVFILDKKKFETAMNFRVGMEKNRDNLLEEFQSLGVVNDANIIRNKVGTRLSFLRRMSMIRKNGYYKKPGFVAKLKTICAEKDWNVAFEGETIIVTDDIVEVVLKLLNNDRLRSFVTEEIFDVSVKKKVVE
jgi:hypothetical protein